MRSKAAASVSAERPSSPRRCQLQVAMALALTVVAAADDYELRPQDIDSSPEGELTGSSGVRSWDSTAVRGITGVASATVRSGRIVAGLTGSPARFPLRWPDPGADLDLGYNDFIDLDLQLPVGFDGKLFLEFTVDETDPGASVERIEVPLPPAGAAGRPMRWRLDLGLVPEWRGFLHHAALVLEPGSASSGKPVAIGQVLLGDVPGQVPTRDSNLNLMEGMKVGDLNFHESKHGCIWWTDEHEGNGFDADVMPRRALRMLEETWQVAVKLLGYRDPCLGVDPSGAKRRKINHITWHSGFWMGGDRETPYFNVSAGGLLDEGWGNPVPHEFAHCVQAAQINFLRGCHWESHANYLRYRRNHHFREIVGNDPMPFGTYLRASFFQDHPRLIYADYRPYFYLDSDPDDLGLAPGLTATLWQTGTADELFWDRLPTVLPEGVSREEVAAGIARSWITFDFPGGREHREAYFPPNDEGAMRRFRALTPLIPVPDRPGVWEAPLGRAPMKFGWCLHELTASGPTVEAKLEGVDVQGEGEGWRWGFVAFRDDGSHVASPTFADGIGGFDIPEDASRLVMFVVATPADSTLTYPRPTPEYAADRHPDHRRYPYSVALKGALPAAHHLELDLPAGVAHSNGGGFVAATATVASSAYVGPDARVLGTARIQGAARVLDRAVVAGAATLQDEAVVSGAAIVTGRAVVRDHARVRGCAYVAGDANIGGRSRIGDFCEIDAPTVITGDAVVRGMAQPLDRGKVGGHAILDVDYSMAFDLEDGVHHHHVPWGGWYFEEFAAKLTKPRGLVASYRFAESDGAQALDEFGSLHATIRGSAVRSDAGLALDGKSQSVSLDPSVIDAAAATWVIEAEVTGSGMQPLFAVNDWTTEGLILGVSATGQPGVVLKRNGQAPVSIASRSTLVRGANVRLALRMDGTHATLFQNGRKVGQQPWPFPPDDMFRDLNSAQPTHVHLGREPHGAMLDGRLMRFQAFNRALDDEELSQAL